MTKISLIMHAGRPVRLLPRHCILFAAVLLAALIAQPASAYQSQSDCNASSRHLTFGAHENCRLTSADPVLADRGTHYHDWTVSMTQGQTVQIDLESNDFDSFLQVLAPGRADALQENDDRGGGSLNSRIFFTAPATGQFIVRVTRLYGSEDGSYSLSVGAPISIMEPIDVADRIEGHLTDQDPVGPGFLDRPMRYIPYRFEVRPGERIQIDVTSNDLDTSLVVMNAAGQRLVSNDNGGENRNARAFLAPPPGRYIVRAGGPTEQSGSFVLNLTRSIPPPPAPPIPITVGASRTGTLTTRSMADVNGVGRITAFFDLFNLVLEAGQVVSLEVRSPEFRPLLAAGVDSFLGFANVGQTLPASPGQPARVVIRATRRGTALIKVMAIGGTLGTYTLTVSSQPDEGAAAQ